MWGQNIDIFTKKRFRNLTFSVKVTYKYIPVKEEDTLSGKHGSNLMDNNYAAALNSSSPDSSKKTEEDKGNRRVSQEKRSSEK